MKTIINITITKQGGGGECLKKEFDLPFLLVPGIEIEDPAWQDSRKIVSVLFNTEDSSIYAGLEMTHKSVNEFDQYVTMLKSHNWSLYC